MPKAVCTFDEATFYLVREMGDLGIPAAPEAFEVALQHVREHGLARMSKLEVRALIKAAKLRGRIDELDEAVKRHERRERQADH